MENEEQKTRAEDTTMESATPVTPAETRTTVAESKAEEDNASIALDAEAQKLAEEIDQEFSADLLEEERIVEALLFTMGRSVGLDEIATALNAGKKIAQDAVERLIAKYEERKGGTVIRRLEKRYQMAADPACYPALIRVAKQPKKPVLTDVVMETLSIIAYKQPVTKAEIERIRGVSSDHAVNRLVEYGLAYEVGRLNAPGRPALFATTEEFLRRFGVSSIQELPDLNPEVEAEIRQEVHDEVVDIMGHAEEAAPEEGTADSGDASPADAGGGAQ